MLKKTIGNIENVKCERFYSTLRVIIVNIISVLIDSYYTACDWRAE